MTKITQAPADVRTGGAPRGSGDRPKVAKSGGFGGIGRALSIRDFRVYSIGNITSLLGSWMHRMALGWLTWETTQSPALLGAIMDHFQSGRPVLAEGTALAEDETEEFYDEADHDTVATIKDLLETRVRPAVAGDGGDITFRGYRDGIVYLEMKGACWGCPSSTATLRQGVQNLFRHFLPSVREVQAI